MNEKKYYVFEMNLMVLNIISMIILVIIMGITILLYKMGIVSNWDYPIGLIFILMIPYLVVHELLHSLAYVVNGADFKNVTYGAHLEKSILCCLCKQRISRKNILISLIVPFIFIGVITYVIGIIFEIPTLIALSIINISGCSGDLIMFFDFIRLKDFEYSEYDNPTAFGLYTNKDLSKKKMFGLKYIESTKKLEIKDLRKIVISRASIAYFIIILVVGLLYMCI